MSNTGKMTQMELVAYYLKRSGTVLSKSELCEYTGLTRSQVSKACSKWFVEGAINYRSTEGGEDACVWVPAEMRRPRPKDIRGRLISTVYDFSLEHEGPFTVQMIAEGCNINKSQASSAASSLVEKGYLTRMDIGQYVRNDATAGSPELPLDEESPQEDNVVSQIRTR
jgi:predicted transcriptional regulator